jgi:hypothetical protein
MSTTERDSRWKLTERIASTQAFVKSPRLSSLLLYVVKQSLDGRDSELNEQLIGERVFGRAVGYDPRDDNIVRAHASRLRQKLEAYYREEGKDDLLRISIPRGSYAPSFTRVETSSVVRDPDPQSADDKQNEHPNTDFAFRARRLVYKPQWIIGGFICVVLVLISLWSTRQTWRSLRKPRQDPTDLLWAALFDKNRDSFIVPADSGLIILKSLTGNPVTAANYASGRYLSDITCKAPCDPTLLEALAAHRYTSLADLQFAVDLTHLPQALQNRPQIRYARDLQLEDLKKSNLVLIGSLESDPWLQFFQSQMNFILHDDRNVGPLRIENKRPRPREQSSYLYDRKDPSHRGYALVTFIPNLSGTGDVLIVQGFTLADTQAAADFVTNHQDFDTLFNPIVARRHGLPHFEILLRTMDVNGFGTRPSIVTFRIY